VDRGRVCRQIDALQMSDTVLKIGMPAARWLIPTGRQSHQAARAAGFKIAGYDTGGPAGSPRLATVRVGRPAQEFATSSPSVNWTWPLRDDWIASACLNCAMITAGRGTPSVLSLKRGSVRLVGSSAR